MEHLRKEGTAKCGMLRSMEFKRVQRRPLLQLAAEAGQLPSSGSVVEVDETHPGEAWQVLEQQRRHLHPELLVATNASVHHDEKARLT